SFHRQRLIGLFDLCADVGERQVGVHLTRGLSNGANDGLWITRGAYLESRPVHSTQRLSPGKIGRRLNVFALVGVFRIFDQADDLDLIDVVLTEAEALADGIFVGEISPREGLIDDYDARRALVVLPCEGAPGQQRNLHRLEKVFASLMNVYRAALPNLSIR